MEGGRSGHASERSELQRAEQANASGVSKSSRMGALVFLKLGTRQTKKPRITHPKNCTDHSSKTVHKKDQDIGCGHSAQRCQGRRAGGAPGFKLKDNINQYTMVTSVNQ